MSKPFHTGPHKGCYRLGCEACEDTRIGLPEYRRAFEAMRATLRSAPRPPFDSGYKKAMLNYALACATWHAQVENVLAHVAAVTED